MSAATARWAVTINVGSGPGNTPARTAGMLAWAKHAAATEQPALVFAQEVTDSWLDAWGQDYIPFAGVTRGWRIHSAVLAHRDLRVTSIKDETFPSLRYHGEYLATCRWEDSPVGPLVCVSVHASPNLAEPDTYGWTRPTPPARRVPNDRRYRPGLWDSDLVLMTLTRMVEQGHKVLVAGDFNESRLDDQRPGGDPVNGWGQQYFKRAAKARFHEPLHEAWKGERPTRGQLQLDHVLVSHLDVMGKEECYLDPMWADQNRVLSDHNAVWFPLA